MSVTPGAVLGKRLAGAMLSTAADDTTDEEILAIFVAWAPGPGSDR